MVHVFTSFTRLILISLALCTSSVFADPATVPNFETQVDHGDSAHPTLWAIEILPPPGHHFNLEAPHSAKIATLQFDVADPSAEKIIFQKDDATLKSGDSVEVSAFICDEKKTYCLKKKVVVTLDANQAKIMLETFAPQKPRNILKEGAPKKTKPFEARELFIDNDSARAISDAKFSNKPLLIDFYGIWCPPCNLYVETIFSTKEFADLAKNFILLKMDADSEKSWVLKSKFKVGGYPTLVVAKVSSKGELEDVGRIVGYYPLHDFNARLYQIYLHHNDSPASRWKGRMEEFLAMQLEQKNYDEIIKLTEEAAAAKIVDAKILIYRWIAEVKKSDQFIKDEKNLVMVKSTLESFARDAKKINGETIMNAIDFLNDEFWLKQEKYSKMTGELIADLEKRLDPKSLFVKGTEVTIADLDSIKMDLAETLKNDTQVAKVRKIAILHYEKLLSLYKKETGKADPRALNLEYSYLLWKDGRVEEAKKLYAQFIQLYPLEFTFYFAASKMYDSLKDYPKARELAEKAKEYSYGDNKIRAVDRLVSAMSSQGEKAQALTLGNEFIKSFKLPVGLDVRTGRYIDHLKQTLMTLSGVTVAEGEKK